MSVDQQIGRFNVYDIFSTFLPGAILLVGVISPHPSVDAYANSLTVSSLIVLSIIAFTIGLFLQIIAGALVSVEDAFVRRIDRIIEPGNEDESVTGADVNFVEAAREEFALGVNFDEWALLYRGVLSELERARPSRAIRLQALFLAMRGLVVGLSIVYLTTATYLVLFYLRWTTLSLPAPLLVAVLFVLLPVILVGYRRAGEFADNVVSYMIIEYSGRGS